MLSKKNIEKIMMIGQSLFGEFHHGDAPSCPLCGGNTFRFYGGNRVKCMLCSNDGIMKTETTDPKFEIKADKFELFLSKDKALEHKRWLQDMKTKFFKEKEQLMEIRNSYRDGWDWIKPEKPGPGK